MPVSYECELCSKIFNHKGMYDRHLQRLNPCNPKESKNDTKVEPKNPKIDFLAPTQCASCLKVFFNKTNKTRHEKTNKKCKIIWGEDLKYKKLEDKLAEMELMIKTGLNPLAITNSNNTNNTNTNTNSNNTTQNTIINNNFVLSKFGHEDTSYITDKEKIYNLTAAFTSVSNFILMKHFNKEHPENCNVYISNMKSAYALIYDGTNWIIKDKKEVLHDIYENNFSNILTNFNELKHTLTKEVIVRFKQFMEEEKDEDDELKNRFKEEIKYILYNHRKQAMDVRKITESPTYKLENSIENK